MKETKYYRLNIVMKTGFKYSTTCVGRMLEGIKKSSGGYWTESIEVVEISEEEHQKHWGETVFDKTPTSKKKVQKTTKKEKLPQFSNIEDFLKD